MAKKRDRRGLSQATFNHRTGTLVDAVTTMAFNLTKKRMKKAVPRDHFNCGMAFGVRESFGLDEGEVFVDATMTYAWMPCPDDAVAPHNAEYPKAQIRAGQYVWLRFENPHKVRDQIDNLDDPACAQFTPGVYNLHPPTRRARKAKLALARLDAGIVPQPRGGTTVRSRHRRPRYTQLERES